MGLLPVACNALWGIDELDYSGAAGGTDIWVATRPDVSAAFEAPQDVTEVSSTALDSDPGISADGRTLYFGSGRSGGLGNGDEWYATRDCQ